MGIYRNEDAFEAATAHLLKACKMRADIAKSPEHVPDKAKVDELLSDIKVYVSDYGPELKEKERTLWEKLCDCFWSVWAAASNCVSWIVSKVRTLLQTLTQVLCELGELLLASVRAWYLFMTSECTHADVIAFCKVLVEVFETILKVMRATKA